MTVAAESSRLAIQYTWIPSCRMAGVPRVRDYQHRGLGDSCPRSLLAGWLDPEEHAEAIAASAPAPANSAADIGATRFGHGAFMNLR